MAGLVETLQELAVTAGPGNAGQTTEQVPEGETNQAVICGFGVVGVEGKPPETNKEDEVKD